MAFVLALSKISIVSRLFSYCISIALVRLMYCVLFLAVSYDMRTRLASAIRSYRSIRIYCSVVIVMYSYFTGLVCLCCCLFVLCSPFNRIVLILHPFRIHVMLYGVRSVFVL